MNPAKDGVQRHKDAEADQEREPKRRLKAAKPQEATDMVVDEERDAKNNSSHNISINTTQNTLWQLTNNPSPPQGP